MMTKEKSLTVTLVTALIIIGLFGLFGFHLVRLGSEYTKEKQRSESLQEQLTQVTFNLETKEETIKQLKKELFKAQNIKQEMVNKLTVAAIKLGWVARGHGGMSLEDVINPYK